MLRIRTLQHVMIGTALSVLVAVIGVLIHVEVNYPVDMRPIVRERAVIATTVVTIAIASVMSFQLRKSYLLTVELQRLVDRDRLTDVATRDFFFAHMRRETDAYGVSLMVDIDLFKAVNDTFGHMAGDAVISRVAEILHENIRADDIVCRFGGEEFVIFLHQQSTPGGFEIAERMRKAIAADVIDYDGQSMAVTVSIGGSLKERLADIDMAIQQADRALYRAKSAGRNRTVFATDIVTAQESRTA